MKNKISNLLSLVSLALLAAPVLLISHNSQAMNYCDGGQESCGGDEYGDEYDDGDFSPVKCPEMEDSMAALINRCSRMRCSTKSKKSANKDGSSINTYTITTSQGNTWIYTYTQKGDAISNCDITVQ